MPQVRHLPVNTGRREGESEDSCTEEGSGAFGARVLWYHWSSAPLGTTGSAHRAGWFKGEFCAVEVLHRISRSAEVGL